MAANNGAAYCKAAPARDAKDLLGREARASSPAADRADVFGRIDQALVQEHLEVHVAAGRTAGGASTGGAGAATVADGADGRDDAPKSRFHDHMRAISR